MLPTPLFVSSPEPLLGATERVCDPRSDREGVRLFLQFVMDHQGGGEGRVTSPCGAVSGHASGRAWDWMISANVPEERARADELIGWLLANDADIFRRAGLYYIIWDRKIWSATHPEWRPYDGYNEEGECTLPGGCKSSHVDHVHFSFNAPGADGLTSFYDWLRGEHPVPVPVPPAPSKPGNGDGVALALSGFVVGIATAMYLARRGTWRRIWRRS